jgi:MYXO-CTERM domain-containing protein
MALQFRQIAQFAAVAVVAATAIVAAPGQAKADTLFDGWAYTKAGVGNGTGGSVFDYQGLAIKDTGDSITVAINSGMDLNGSLWRDEIVNHGDLFFNFTGKSFKEASAAGELMAVNFAQLGSQSGATETGVYANVSAKNVTTQNYGWHNTNGWKAAVNGNHSYGDMTSDDAYFAGQQTGTKAILNSIGTGTRVGSIMNLSSAQLSAAGLNFGHVGAAGTQTLGFSFKKTPGFKLGSFVANLFMECGNDGIAIRSNLTQKTPEPAFMTGMAIVGGLGLLRRRRRQG